jgi:integrase
MFCTQLALKMEILPQKNRQGIRLQFSVGGQRFSFSPLKGGKWKSKRDRSLVAAIGTKIGNDILAGAFDPTLEKYRHKFYAENAGENFLLKTSKARWLEIWDNFVRSLKLSQATAADHYACVRAMLVKAGNPWVSDIDWLCDRTDLAASTFNRRLSMLQKCAFWAIDQKIILKNPLIGVESRSQTLAEEERVESKKAPFNSAEVERIIAYFYEHHPNYEPFVKFLLFSGVRTGEAIGLRWQDIDLEKGIIAIEQSISRERGKYTKVRKRPKTLQSRRILKMSQRVYDLFLFVLQNRGHLEGLIFKTVKGCEIDHGNFRNQYWKPALEQLNIPYRKPYATRHTLLSEALEAGLTIPQVAAIAGHKDGRMILKHYGRVINQVQLPD